MEDNQIYRNICETYTFDEINSTIYFKSQSNITDFHKELLFQICFPTDKVPPFQFTSLKDIWFFNNENISTQEQSIMKGIINALIRKIRDPNSDISQNNLTLVKSLIDLKDKEKFKIFKYFQSIFSSYQDNPEFIIYPLIYTLTFDNIFMRNAIKRDLKSIIDPYLEKLNMEDLIIYSKLNVNFLKYLNGLKNQQNKAIINICYNYLCNNEKMITDNKENNFTEKFVYFSTIKDIIIDNEKRIEQTKEANTQTDNDNSPGKINGKQKTFISNTTDKTENYSLEQNGIHNGENLSPIQLVLNLVIPIMELNNLCSRIPVILDKLNIKTDAVEKYYKLLNSNMENKLLLNKLSSTILILQNTNIINLKRKLIEVLLFEIMEKHQDKLYFSKDYFPSYYLLNDLIDMAKKYLTQCTDEEKENVKKDLIKFDELKKEANEKKLKVLYMLKQ